MKSLHRLQVKLGLVLLWGITFFTPLVIAPSFLFAIGSIMHPSPVYMFIFGLYYPPGSGSISGWISGPLLLLYIFTLLFFFLIYAVLVTRYCMNPTSQRGAIVTGLISLLIPFLMVGGISLGIYTGPVPVQFIVGLIVLQIVKRGIKSPKDELLDEKTWWEENQSDSDVDK